MDKSSNFVPMWNTYRTLLRYEGVVGNKFFIGGCMCQHNKQFDEWWAKQVENGDGSWTSLERLAAKDAWEAATKLVEEKFTSTNRPSVEIKPDCGNCLLASQCNYYGFPSDSCGYIARV